MKLPDTVTISRPTARDEYGNPGSSFVGATTSTTKGFLVKPTMLLLAAGTDLRRGDRVRVRDHDYSLDEAPLVARSPSRDVLVVATLTPLET